MANTSQELFARYCGGSEDAATAIFGRYVQRLTSLARIRMSDRLARRIDPDDVVLSAYRSFFIAAKDGRFVIKEGGDLWRLLVSITMHKLHNQVSAHQSQKRSMAAESLADITEFISSHDPSPEDVLIACEELEAIMKALPPLGRQVVELRMQGESLEMIARETSRTERTVRRMLDLARKEFTRRTNRDLEQQLSQFDPEPRRDSDRPEPSAVVLASHPQSRPKAEDPRAPLRYADYVLHRLAGSGASGKVYFASQRVSGQFVAVKFLKKNFLSRTEIVEQFVTEARLTSQLRHPGIIGAYGLGCTPWGGYFSVLDWVPGGDLGVEMTRSSIKLTEAIRWSMEAAIAIQFAHEHGIIHCDLKPANLLLDAARHVVVTDFGLALSMDHFAKDSRQLAGTAAFMALEQVVPSVGEIGRQTDVYGLGAVMYALITGQPPHTGSRPADIFGKIVAGRPIRRPSELRSGIPDLLESLCRQCLEREPANRPASAFEVASRLDEIATSSHFDR